MRRKEKTGKHEARSAKSEVGRTELKVQRLKTGVGRPELNPGGLKIENSTVQNNMQLGLATLTTNSVFHELAIMACRF